MVLLKIYNQSKNPSLCSSGFTLLEVLMVVAIMSVVAGTSLFFTTSRLQREALLSERRHLVVVLQSARANAMNNVSQTPHGVALYPPGVTGYVIFSGSTYSSREQSMETIVLVDHPVRLGSTTPLEIIFSQLSGDSNYEGEIVLSDLGSTSSTSIFINYEGKIGW